MMPDSEDTVLADLDSALDARLIQARQLGRGERYGFMHALVHQALYGATRRIDGDCICARAKRSRGCVALEPKWQPS